MVVAPTSVASALTGKVAGLQINIQNNGVIQAKISFVV
jgi:hypothetical protein